jgi:hypothetical protein
VHQVLERVHTEESARQDTIVFSDSTRVKNLGKIGKITDLKAGTSIVVFYKVKDGKKVARKITVRLEIKPRKPNSPAPAAASGTR